MSINDKRKSRKESYTELKQLINGIIADDGPGDRPISGRTIKAAIVGGGFAALATAIRIGEYTEVPVEVTIAERHAAQVGGGIAYSDSASGWEHRLNVQAGRITLFREARMDFMEWCKEADRSEWPKEFKAIEFGESTSVPRPVYGQYIRDRLNQKVEANDLLTIKYVRAKVSEVVENRDGSMTVKMSMPQKVVGKYEKFDFCVIATGHQDPVVPDFLNGVADRSNVIVDQYSSDGRRRLKHLADDAAVFVVGTGQSAFDAALTLRGSGHKGKIVMVSRNGRTHEIYPSGHEHEILEMPRPKLLDRTFESAEQLLAALVEEYHRQDALLAETRPDIPAQTRPERILKSNENFIAELVQVYPAEWVSHIVENNKSWIVTKRVGTIPEIGAVIFDEDSNITIRKGHITSVEEFGKNRFIVETASDNGVRQEEFDAIVCCLGRQADYTKVTSPLWQRLLAGGLAVPHAKTGQGVSVNDDGQLISIEGSPTQCLFAVGPMRLGDELERNGRTGAFVFSIGTVRNQAAKASKEICRLAQLKYFSGPGEAATQTMFELMVQSAGTQDETLRVAIKASIVQVKKKAIEETMKLGANETLAHSIVHSYYETAQKGALIHTTDISIIAGGSVEKL